MALRPPRLELVQAKDASIAVVFRRGPSDWYCLLKWNTKTGDVEQGAWFRGRYHGAMLSADGRYLSTMLMKAGRVFNVISIAPWLHPLHSEERPDTWGSCWRIIDADEPPQRDEFGVGPSKARPTLRLTEHWRWPMPNRPAVPAHLLPSDLQWAEAGRGGRVLMATKGGEIQITEVRGGTKLKVLASFDTAALTPDPQPPPSYATRWGPSAPEVKRLREKRGQKRPGK